MAKVERKATKKSVRSEDARIDLGTVHTLSHDHLSQLPRLRRIRGQVDGVERMIQDKRYCVDIIQQIRAARSALLSLENEVLQTHLRNCVHKAFTTQNALDAERKIKEIADLLSR